MTLGEPAPGFPSSSDLAWGDPQWPLARLEAFKGFSFGVSFVLEALAMWVAILQFPMRHLVAGSGNIRQYVPVGNCLAF